MVLLYFNFDFTLGASSGYTYTFTFGKEIDCLFEFTKTDGSNGKFNFWCVGIIIDVCDGSEIDKWKRLRGFYNDGEAAEVHWEAVLGHDESETVQELKPTLFNRHSLGGWRYYYKI